MAKGDKDDAPPWALVLPLTVISCIIAILASPGSAQGPDGYVPRFQSLTAEFALSRRGGPVETELKSALAPLLGQLKGRVLQVGAGTGALLDLYSSTKQVVAAEECPFLLKHLRSIDGTAEIMNMSVTNMSGIPNASIDAVVAVRTLCTANHTAALPEIKRVLKSGGKLVLLEPVIDLGDRAMRRLQMLASPAYEIVSQGCRIDDDLAGILASAGFVLDVSPLSLASASLPILRPHLLGTAQAS